VITPGPAGPVSSNNWTKSKMTDWFTSHYSNAELREILQNYQREVYQTSATVPASWGRCTLVRELERLDEITELAQTQAA
jgi:23S rRNA maturation mini-RNase III